MHRSKSVLSLYFTLFVPLKVWTIQRQVHGQGKCQQNFFFRVLDGVVARKRGTVKLLILLKTLSRQFLDSVFRKKAKDVRMLHEIPVFLGQQQSSLSKRSPACLSLCFFTQRGTPWFQKKRLFASKKRIGFRDAVCLSCKTNVHLLVSASIVVVLLVDLFQAFGSFGFGLGEIGDECGH